MRTIVERLRRGAPDARDRYRQLQPYIVSRYSRQSPRYRRDGRIVPVTSGLGEWLGKYDAVRGLTPEGRDLDRLVV